MPVVRKIDSIKYDFIPKRLQLNQDTKIYKNKLTSILRTAEKEHYSKLLSDAKGNIKDTRKILNAAMNKKRALLNFRLILN